jgi:hypothetical protein
MVNVQTGMDTIGTSSGNIPTGTAFVGCYVSGEGDVPWSQEQMARFPETSLIRIYQGAGSYPGVGGYDMMDVESGAITVAQCASEGEKRVNAEYQWTIIYGTDSTLSEVSSALQALGESIWNGHFACFLANWNLNENEAEALLGTSVHGMTCVGVQWASPSSNPNTICPGTEKTLKEMNIDLSVIDASFLPIAKAPIEPNPPGQPLIIGMVVYEPSGSDYGAKDVQSADGGKTWTVTQ